MQSNLAKAVRDPHIDMPTRFNIYRNNHWVSVLESMKAAFPMTVRLVGEAYFTQLARAFLEKSPPTSRLMMELGQGFPEFIDNLNNTVTLSSAKSLGMKETHSTPDSSPTALNDKSFFISSDLPYLADFTRLELLRTESYHAEDAPSLMPQDFAGVEDLAALRFTFHPSMRLLKSDYPVFSIYNDMISGVFEGGGEGVIIRPLYDIEIYPADVDFLKALQNGASLGEAFTNQNETLTLLIQRGLCTA
jgi:hypothetical protein